MGLKSKPRKNPHLSGNLKGLKTVFVHSTWKKARDNDNIILPKELPEKAGGSGHYAFAKRLLCDWCAHSSHPHSRILLSIINSEVFDDVIADLRTRVDVINKSPGKRKRGKAKGNLKELGEHNMDIPIQSLYDALVGEEPEEFATVACPPTSHGKRVKCVD